MFSVHYAAQFDISDYLSIISQWPYLSGTADRYLLSLRVMHQVIKGKLMSHF